LAGELARRDAVTHPEGPAYESKFVTTSKIGRENIPPTTMKSYVADMVYDEFHLFQVDKK
jgi:hypothetical protein